MGIFPSRKVVERLPPAVQRALQTQERHTEFLISLIQLLLVLFFAALWAAARKTAPAEAPLHPVPWALGLYGLLTLARVVWTRRHNLPDWAVSASIFADIGLLLALIFSFHIVYGQPPSFYLKAPTLLYVFIFIALRALRFQARFVVLTGAVAAVGWLLMIGYVLVAEQGNPMVTRDYVTYLTSNSILVGGEIDKIVAMVVVTGILALALVRGRELLVRSVAEARAAEQLSRFLAPEVADVVRQESLALAPGQGQLREAAIVFLDLRGFSAFAARSSPDEVLGVLARYRAFASAIIRGHGGSIDKFVGDGVLATFGATTEHPRAAAAAVEALAAVVAPDGRLPLAVNGALDWGPVVFGTIGDERRLEATVIGEAVNRAAKLEKANKASGTRALVSERAFLLARAQGLEAEDAWRPVSAKGDPLVEGMACFAILQ